MGQIFSDYVHACMNFWQQQQNYQSFAKVTNQSLSNLNDPDPGFEVAVFNDPANGNTIGGLNGGKEQSGGLLIVGCNPSGVAKHRGRRTIQNPPVSNSVRDFYLVNTYQNGTPIDSYTKTIHDFAVACGYGGNYYKMDLFGIMQKKQSVLMNDIKRNPNRYQRLFEIFVDTVISLQPEKIVFANAFVSQVVCDNSSLLVYDNANNSNYSSIRNNLVQVRNVRNNKGGLEIRFTHAGKTLKSLAWFSSMLSGQRALDNGSKDLLIWSVR